MRDRPLPSYSEESSKFPLRRNPSRVSIMSIYTVQLISRSIQLISTQLRKIVRFPGTSQLAEQFQSSSLKAKPHPGALLIILRESLLIIKLLPKAGISPAKKFLLFYLARKVSPEKESNPLPKEWPQFLLVSALPWLETFTNQIRKLKIRI